LLKFDHTPKKKKNVYPVDNIYIFIHPEGSNTTVKHTQKEKKKTEKTKHTTQRSYVQE